MELPKCLPFYGQAWLDLKTFQVFNQQPMVHIGLQREPSKRSPLRDKTAKRNGWLSPWTRLILNRWQKYTPITIINNQRLAAAVTWLEGPKGLGLSPARIPFHLPPGTKLWESEQAREES